MAPIAKGLGFAVVSVGLLFAFYYNVVVSWAVWYLLASLQPVLEWSHCGHVYNTEHCWSEEEQGACQDQGLVFYSNHCSNLETVCGTWDLEAVDERRQLCGNDSLVLPLTQLATRVSASEEYYERNVLGIKGHDWSNFGSIR